MSFPFVRRAGGQSRPDNNGAVLPRVPPLYPLRRVEDVAIASRVTEFND
jgi:hypothetical protein